MKKSRIIQLFSIITMAAAGVFGAVTLSNKSKATETKVVSAGDMNAPKDTPMIVNAWDSTGCVGSGLYDGCDVGIYCYDGDLEKNVTIKMEKVTDTMGVGIVPKGTKNMIVVRAPSGSLPCDGFPSSKYNQWSYCPFNNEKNVITIKHWPNEGDNQYFSDRKEILIKDKPVMFDCDSTVGNWWFNNDCTSYVMTNSQSNWYRYTSNDGWNALTRIGNTGYMYFIPSTTIIADYVIVSRNTHNTPGWSAKQNQTTNMTSNYGFNPLYTTQIESGTSDGKQNWGNKSANETASEYGCFFMDKITCSGNGSITSPSSNWTTVTNFYNGLTKDVQGECWNSSANPSGSNIEKAVDRYDYIVFFKQYSGYNDFMNRATSPGKSRSGSIMPLIIGARANNSLIAVILISAIGITSIGGYFFTRRRKENI